MSSSDLQNSPHVEELLSAYALDALEEDEAAQAEAHLEVCPGCRQVLAELQHAAALLGQSVDPQTPPVSLLAQVMAALDRVSGPAPAPAPALATATAPSGSNIRLIRLALPLAASVAVALFAISLVVNLRVSNQVDRLERDNSALSDRLAQSSTEDSRIQETLTQVQVASYLMAAPGTQTVSLHPMRGAIASQGVLLVSSDGNRAILMVTDMEQRGPASVYQVWLIRNGQLVGAGEVQVNSAGWGSAFLRPPESVFQFDRVALTVDEEAGSVASSDEIVIGGEITIQ